jgi:hypothetical protein
MRWSAVLLVALAACRKHAPIAEEAAAGPPPPPEVIPPRAARDAPVDDPAFHVRPDEASVTITPARAAIGAPARATIRVVPGSGFHLSTEYKVKLELGSTAQVAITDRTEEALTFDITATPRVAGEQHIDGFLHVGICESTSCRSRRQPVSIAVIGE